MLRFGWLVTLLLVISVYPLGIISSATFTVTNSLDTGAGSLREAITNANLTAGHDTISFDPAGAPYSINLITPLGLTDNTGVTIDGWSAGGAGYTGSPRVEINGTGAIGTTGLLITSPNNTVFGLAINRMRMNAYALTISGPTAQNNWIYGCFIGTNIAGTAQLQNQDSGIYIANGASNNLIGTNSDGTNDTAERNLIAGNRWYGIALATASDNRVSGNYFGTDITGSFAICNGCTGAMNGGDSVLISAVSTGNIIGTNGDGVNDGIEGNLISGTEVSNNGVFIRDIGTSNNWVAGNLIGTNAAGNGAIRNGGGVSITYGASNNLIGTNGDGVSDALERNVISGNLYHGVQIIENNTTGNRVSGNYIGTSISGLTLLPNGRNGVEVFPGGVGGGPVNNIIGTNADGSPGDPIEGNLISGNGSIGVEVYGATSGTIIAGNLIGTTATGGAALGNGTYGIYIFMGASNTRIGVATLPYERNVISGNNWSGVNIVDQTTTNTIVNGNYIGTDISGTLSIPNRGIGIAATQATNVTIGTAAPNTGNIVSNNWGHGIQIYGAVASATNNIVQNNNQIGIRVEPYYGANTSPATAADDRLSVPLLTGNRIDGNCVTLAVNCAGIFAIDTAPQNAATLEVDNMIGTNNGRNDVEQRWYGALEIISGNTPIASTAAIVSSGGTNYAMTSSTTCVGVMNNTILHGVSPLSCINVPTWTQFTEFVVNPAGARINHVPHTIATPPTTYSFDANAATNPTDSGYGFIGEGIATGPFSRYQVMETTAPDPLPTVIATTPANGAVGVALNANVLINFSENVTASGAWFTINCTLSGNHAAVVTGGAQNYTLNPAADFVLGDVCTVTVLAGQIQDQDIPLGNMAADYVFTFGIVDAPPFVASTVPANGAVGVLVTDTISITFSETVNTGAGWFDITCSTSGNHTAAVVGVPPALTFTLDPAVDFNYNETCTVTIFAAQVTDTDVPADNMAADYVFTFTTVPAPTPGYASAPVNPGGAINFGSVLVGQTVIQTLTITENGNADLIINTLVLPNPNFTVTSASALPATIVDGSGGNVILTISCTPRSTGLISATLSVTHNAPGGIADYTLRCQGIVPQATASAPGDQSQPGGTASFDPAISKLGFLQRGQLGVNGEVIEWIVTVFNPSSVIGQNVIFSDTLRPELRIDRVETGKGTAATSGQTITVTIGDLAPGENVQISIFTTVLSGGTTIDNTACISANNLADERCATGSVVKSLPATGEAPLWRWQFVVLLAMGMVGLWWGLRRYLHLRHS